MKNKNSSRLIVFTTILLTISLSCVFSVYNKWNNTLFKNDYWISSKTELHKSLMGASAFMLTHYTLAGDELNLSAYFGYQEVFYKNAVDAKNLELDFKLDDDAYLNVLLENKHDTLTGIRISNNAKFPNIVFQVFHGEFIRKTNLPQFKLDENWNALELVFANDETTISLNGKPYENIFSRSLSVNAIGFRGNAYASFIDNISFFDNKTQSLITEDFENPDSIWPQILISLFIIVLFIVLQINFQQKLELLSLGTFSFTFICVILWGAYVLKFQHIYLPLWTINWHGLESTIEDSAAVNDRIQKIISSKTNNSDTKILFIGSSQTWGAGASTTENTFVHRFENLVNAHDTTESVTCINTGISGLTSTELFKFYQEKWISAAPKVVIINLSNNDISEDKLRKNMQRFIDLNEKRNIKTLLILEPNDEDNEGLLLKHEVIRSLAKENNIACIDMHKELLKHYDDGFLFWDFVHLTDFGQKLFAEILFEAYQKETQQTILPKLEAAPR